MKVLVALVLFVGTMVALAPLLDAGSVSLEEKGRVLFNDPKLGGSATEKSCNSCHPDGKGFENVFRKRWAPGELESMINNCVSRVLKGNDLGTDSDEMKALVAYIQSIGKSP